MRVLVFGQMPPPTSYIYIPKVSCVRVPGSTQISANNVILVLLCVRHIPYYQTTLMQWLAFTLAHDYPSARTGRTCTGKGTVSYYVRCMQKSPRLLQFGVFNLVLPKNMADATRQGETYFLVQARVGRSYLVTLRIKFRGIDVIFQASIHGQQKSQSTTTAAVNGKKDRKICPCSSLYLQVDAYYTAAS